MTSEARELALLLETVAEGAARVARAVQRTTGDVVCESAGASLERALVALRRLLAETPPR